METIIEEIIARLRRDKKRGFARRPCSRYSQAKARRFVEAVLGCEPVTDLLQHVPAEAVADLSEAQQRQLKVIVDRLDR